MRTFVEMLRETMAADGYPSDRQMAFALGCHPSTFSRARRGRIVTLSPVLIQRALNRYPELAMYLSPRPVVPERQVA